MTTEVIMMLVLGAAAGGFVNGLAGFGTSLFALGFWLQVFPPVKAVAISLVVASVTGIQGLWVVRETILSNPHRTLRFLVPGFVGIPFGISALRYVDPTILKLVVAGFMLLYGGFFVLRRRLPTLDHRAPKVDMAVGLTGGFMGGLAGISGAVPVIWCTLHPWTKRETRAVLQPFNLTILAVSAVILAFQGTYDAAMLQAILIALCVSVTAAQLGIFAFGRIGDVQFRWLLIILMFVSGAVLMSRTLAAG
ncbi:sulfite exporter TauE/SafE family protein [Amaricoccus tamworthensis]|uniref:sulfite exporter TauE/SafE family protein n=1 Tax=Amaricoccus tamworthensis TaxID=57002 RepID=UPI003C7C35BC